MIEKTDDIDTIDDIVKSILMAYGNIIIESEALILLRRERDSDDNRVIDIVK